MQRKLLTPKPKSADWKSSTSNPQRRQTVQQVERVDRKLLLVAAHPTPSINPHQRASHNRNLSLTPYRCI